MKPDSFLAPTSFQSTTWNIRECQLLKLLSQPVELQILFLIIPVSNAVGIPLLTIIHGKDIFMVTEDCGPSPFGFVLRLTSDCFRCRDMNISSDPVFTAHIHQFQWGSFSPHFLPIQTPNMAAYISMTPVMLAHHATFASHFWFFLSLKMVLRRWYLAAFMLGPGCLLNSSAMEHEN